ISAQDTVAVCSGNCTPADAINFISEGDINPSDRTSQELKVLVIEINPHLTTIDGNPKALDKTHYAGVERDAIDDKKDDLEVGSRGYYSVNIVKWEYLDEFPTCTTPLTLTNGETAYKLDEKTYLTSLGYYDDGEFSWWEAFVDPYRVKNYINLEWNYSFDYGYLIDKFDLINRRNRGEFDQVWIDGIDPLLAYESIMVGRNSYYINGVEMHMDCDEFPIVTTTPSRRDSNIHAQGHMYEWILRNVYGQSYDPYEPNTTSVSTIEEYMRLNDWERFSLNNLANSGTLNGVGNVHLPWNATDGYDYSNSTPVNTLQTNWLNVDLDNLGTSITSSASEIWLDATINANIPSDQQHPDRLWQRYWLYSMPNKTGYTKQGYLKNWFKYLYSMDFIEGLSADTTSFSLVEDDSIDLDYLAFYRFGNVERGTVSPGNNVSVSNDSVIKYQNGHWQAVGTGTATVSYWRDGKHIDYDFTVVAHDREKPILSIETGYYTSGTWTSQPISVKLRNLAPNYLPVSYTLSQDSGTPETLSDISDYILLNSSEGEHSFVFSATSEAGTVSDPATINIKFDKTRPELEITSESSRWETFLPTVTFGIFGKESKIFTMSATDSLSGIAKRQYLLSENSFSTETEALSADGWTDLPASGELTVDPDRTFILYFSATDNAGNATVVNSDGIILKKEDGDPTDPVDSVESSPSDPVNSSESSSSSDSTKSSTSKSSVSASSPSVPNTGDNTTISEATGETRTFYWLTLTAASCVIIFDLGSLFYRRFTRRF
ncbi:hypothetical protein IJH89_01815, partial [Candidatus Saccharibacteria bacterium]|nr:hypothetical protein [Candidatus Saccharibacteria bacterium]